MPSGCASRCICGTRPCGGRCGRCSMAGSSRPTAWPRRRWRSARTPKPSRRPSTTRSSCSGSGRSRAGWASSRRPRGSSWRRNPHRPAWRAALAALLAEEGDRKEEAQREVDALAAQDFEDIPQDGDWLIAMTLLAECCAELRDETRATQLYELLMPYRDGNVVIGLAAVCMGSAARYLGRLGAAMGRSRRRSSTSSGRWLPTPPSRRRCSWPTRRSTLPGHSARSAGHRADRRGGAHGEEPGPPTGVAPAGTAARFLKRALGGACTWRYPPPDLCLIRQDARHRREALRRARPRARAPGAVHQERGISRGPRAHDHLGCRPPRPARRPRRIRRPLQEVADGRSADRAGPFPARRPRRALEEADERRQAADRPKRGRDRRKRLRRRARG